MSSGYGFWSDMSIEDFLNGKVKSVNNYITYITYHMVQMFKLNYFLFSLYSDFLCY